MLASQFGGQERCLRPGEERHGLVAPMRRAALTGRSVSRQRAATRGTSKSIVVSQVFGSSVIVVL